MKNRIFALLTGLLIISSLTGFFTSCASQPSNTSSSKGTSGTTVKTTSASSTQPVFKLRLSTPYTPAEYAVMVFYHFADEVERRSNGRVKFERFNSESLGKSAEHLEMVRSGTADVVQLVPALYMNEMPLNAFIQSASTSVGATQQQALDNTLKFSQIPEVKAILEKEQQRLGIKILGYQMLGPSGTVSRVPLTRLEDLKGYKINGNPVNNPIYQHYGIIPANVQIADAYESLSKGVIDAYNSSTFGVYGLKVWQLGKWYREIPQIGIGLPIIVNQKTWNRLPPDIQQIFIQASNDMSVESVKTFDDITAKAWADMKKAWLDVGYYPKEDQDTWGKLQWQSLKETWYAAAKKAGYQAQADILMKDYQQVWGPR